jgi:hypothetical protein
MKTLKPIKVRTEGSTPVQKWINLVKKWNSCVGHPNNIFAQQRMLFTKAEANDLLSAYPQLKDAIKYHEELETYQIEVLKYGDYPLMEGYSFETTPKAVIIEGYKLVD